MLYTENLFINQSLDCWKKRLNYHARWQYIHKFERHFRPRTTNICASANYGYRYFTNVRRWTTKYCLHAAIDRSFRHQRQNPRNENGKLLEIVLQFVFFLILAFNSASCFTTFNGKLCWRHNRYNWRNNRNRSRWNGRFILHYRLEWIVCHQIWSRSSQRTIWKVCNMKTSTISVLLIDIF